MGSKNAEQVAGELELRVCEQHTMTEAEWNELQEFALSEVASINMHALNAIICDSRSERKPAYIDLAQELLVKRRGITRATALLALDRLGDPTAVAWAERLKQDSDVGVRAQAKYILEKHSGGRG